MFYLTSNKKKSIKNLQYLNKQIIISDNLFLIVFNISKIVFTN